MIWPFANTCECWLTTALVNNQQIAGIKSIARNERNRCIRNSIFDCKVMKIMQIFIKQRFSENIFRGHLQLLIGVAIAEAMNINSLSKKLTSHGSSKN